MAATTSSNLHLPVPSDGRVIVTVKPSVSEREVVMERDNIIQMLHAAYLNLNNAMAPFQTRWDANPAMALVEATLEGASDGGATWLADQADMFDRQRLRELARSLQNTGAECLDRFANYSRQQYKDLEREVNKHVSDPQKTLLNWVWWEGLLEEKAERVGAAHVAAYDTLLARAQEAKRTVATGMTTAGKLVKHREAIMRLPVLIAEGVPGPIQSFIENELMDIDPVLAKAIRSDPRFGLVLEVLADRESTLTYLSYAGLMIEAIPPNFMAYVAGKGGMYLIIEVVLLICTALLSAGAAAAARVAMLVARIGGTAARVSGASRKYRNARVGVDAFVRVLDDIGGATQRLHGLAPKMRQARARGATAHGGTRTSLRMKKESIKRDGRCRICGSPKHTTPTNQRGTVKYK